MIQCHTVNDFELIIIPPNCCHTLPRGASATHDVWNTNETWNVVVVLKASSLLIFFSSSSSFSWQRPPLFPPTSPVPYLPEPLSEDVVVVVDGHVQTDGNFAQSFSISPCFNYDKISN